MVRHNKIVILLGAIVLLASLMWMLEPYYTWAQDNGHPCRVELAPEVPLFELENINPGDTEESSVTVTKTGSASAELFFAWEYIEGNPELGEDGSLFDQLEMEIISDGTVLFEGLMSDWEYDRDNPSIEDAVNITEKLEMEFMEQGDEITLDFKVHLPGPETGNKYQGATLETRLVFFTICTNGTNGDDPPPPPPPPPPDEPEINIEKMTNGIDADVPTGPSITVGDTVTWTYIVTNPGDVPLSDIEVTDNIEGVNPEYVSGDENEDGILQVDEEWIFEAEGIAEEGQYANIGTVESTSPDDETVTDEDPSHYFGILPDQPAINIEKLTNGVDADLPTGPEIEVGDTVTWTYIVTNPGDVPLTDIEVTDNIEGVNPEYVSGDENEDGILQVDEEWIFEAVGEAEEGQYANIGTVEGTTPDGETVTDDDPSHYIGEETPEVEIVDPEAPEVEPDPDDEETVIVEPEAPRVDPPLPRTDGVSIGMFIFGILLIMAGISLKRSIPADTG